MHARQGECALEYIPLMVRIVDSIRSIVLPFSSWQLALSDLPLSLFFSLPLFLSSSFLLTLSLFSLLFYLYLLLSPFQPPPFSLSFLLFLSLFGSFSSTFLALVSLSLSNSVVSSLRSLLVRLLVPSSFNPYLVVLRPLVR